MIRDRELTGTACERQPAAPRRRGLSGSIRLALLRAFAGLSRPFYPRRACAGQPRRVLVIRPDHLGDALFTFPALRALRQAFPEAAITCLVGPWAADIYLRCDAVDRVLECPFPGFTGKPKRSLVEPYLEVRRWAAIIRREGFDLSLNLRFDFWWGALLAYLARVPIRVGYAIPEVKPFLTAPVPFARRHEVEKNVRLVAAAREACLGTDGEWFERQRQAARLEFPLRAEEKATAARLLAGVGLDDGPVVALHPGTRGTAKLWDAGRWAQVGDAIVRQTGATLLITGSREEEALCTAVKEWMSLPAHVIAGRTSVGELVALFARCGLVLGVDSGPLHMAVAAGTPTVHLFGPSDHLSFGPYGDPERHAIVRSGVACSPCHNLQGDLNTPEPHECMRAITVEMVLRAAERVSRETLPWRSETAGSGEA